MTDKTIETSTGTCPVIKELPSNWKWMLALGVLMVFLGSLGIFASSILTLTSILMFGGFVFSGNIIQLFHGIKAKEKEWGGKVQHFLIALLYIIAGLIIFWDPFATSLVLTFFLASLFAIIGVARIWYAFYSKAKGWKWLLFALSGLLDLILTTIILSSLTESAFWLIGMLIAIEMLLNGWLIVMLALGVRKIEFIV